MKNTLNKYVLESDVEFERLEKQSGLPQYDYRSELKDMVLKPCDRVLDAGCGTGIVSRHYANVHREAEFTACDFSVNRIEQAKKAANGINNLKFVSADLHKLPFDSNSFDVIFCRFVIEHISSNKNRIKVLKELKRCLRPGGTLFVVDMDGPFYNIYPQTKVIETSLELLARKSSVDLLVGRKLPWLLEQSGFEKSNWRIETLEFKGPSLANEAKQIEARFKSAHPFLEKILGSKKKVDQFRKSYSKILSSPGSVLFYNKFITTSTKRARPKMKLVK